MKPGRTVKVTTGTGRTYYAYDYDTAAGRRRLPRDLSVIANNLRREVLETVERFRGAMSVLGLGRHADPVIATALQVAMKQPAKPGRRRNNVSAKVADDLKSLGLEVPGEKEGDK